MRLPVFEASVSLALVAGSLAGCGGERQDTAPDTAVTAAAADGEYRVGLETWVDPLDVAGIPIPDKPCMILEHGVLRILGENTVSYYGSPGPGAECADGTIFSMTKKEADLQDVVHTHRQQDITKYRTDLFAAYEPTNTEITIEELTKGGVGTLTERKESWVDLANPDTIGNTPGAYTNNTSCLIGEAAILMQLGDEELTGGGTPVGVIDNPSNNSQACIFGDVFVRPHR